MADAGASARVTALAAVAATLVVDQPVERTLQSLLTAAVAASGGIAASLQLVDRGTGELSSALTEGLPDGYAEALRASWRAGVRSPTSEAMREQRSEFIIGAVAHGLGNPRYAPLHPLLRTVAWDDILVLPLDSLGRSLGALNVYYLPGAQPDEDERAFLVAVADMGAVAVENARLLAASQRTAAVAERQRLARELHDSVSQALYGIALGARTARTLLDREPSQAAQPLEYVLGLAQAALTEMRSLIFHLRPDALATEGVVVALDKQAEALRVRHGLDVVTELPEEPELGEAAREALYRIATEALHNITKHARAQRVRIALAVEDGHAEMRVEDDGVGFDAAARHAGHLGLQSMRERAEACGGTLVVDSAPGRGSALRVRIPSQR